jgi:hypothetical protein
MAAIAGDNGSGDEALPLRTASVDVLAAPQSWQGADGCRASSRRYACAGDEARLKLPPRLTASTVFAPVEADDNS